MMVLITYDVCTESKGGQKRLRKVAKVCQNYGQRVQNSVFECIVDPARLLLIESQLIEIIDEKKDSLRFYYFGKDWKNKIKHIGAKATINLEGELIL